MDDVEILKGLSNIVNTQNIRSDIDLQEIERSIVAEHDFGDDINEKETIEEKCNNELDEYAKKLGISFESLKTDNEEDDNDYNSDDKENNDSYNVETHSSGDYLSGIMGGDFNKRTELENKTIEEQRHSQVQGVMREMGGERKNVWSIENEKKEDMKTTMLEEIDSLKISLEEDNIDISRIPNVSQENSFEEVEQVLKILRLKNDRMRYCSFAEEFILFGAHGMEELFNGENVWFGKYSPDLTGWHNQVQVKLRRMRRDTSTLVSGIMADYNIGSGLRIVLELIPSMFMYRKLRKQKFGSKKLYSDSAMGDAMNRIRNIDEGYDDKN